MSLYGKTKHPYYNSVTWKFLHTLASKRTKAYCGLCVKPKDVVHHLTYDRFQHEDIRDLIPLCFDHHERLEEDKRLNRIILKISWNGVRSGANGDVLLLQKYGEVGGRPYVPYYDVFLSMRESHAKWSICTNPKTEKEREESKLRIAEEKLFIDDGLISRNPVIRRASEQYLWWLNFYLRMINYRQYIDNLTEWPPKLFNPNNENEWI